MKLVAYPLAALLGFLGLMFIVGAQGQIMRIVVGVILLAAAGALVWLAMQRPKESTTTVVQKIDLSGDVNLQDMTCRACGGSLSKDSVERQGRGRLGPLRVLRRQLPDRGGAEMVTLRPAGRLLGRLRDAVRRDWAGLSAAAAARLPIRPGLYRYEVHPPGGTRQIHLRIDRNGGGVLWIDVADVIHLNPTAALLARLALDGTPPDRPRALAVAGSWCHCCCQQC